MPTHSDPRAWRAELESATRRPGDGGEPRSALRPHCANPTCRRGWLGFLKDHRRPLFEGRWACSPHCLRAGVEIAVRRESPATTAPQHEPEHRIPLGLILLTRGWITQTQLQHALTMQRGAHGGRLGQWLIEECGIPEERILHGLALQWRCNVLSPHGFHASAMALAVPRTIVERVSMLPLRLSSRGSLRVAFVDRPNPAAAFALERMSGLQVDSGLISHADWRSACEVLFASNAVRCSLEHLSGNATLARRIASDIAGMQPRASRLVRIQNLFWLRMWLEDTTPRGPYGAIPTSPEDMLDRLYTVDPPPTA